MAPSSPLSDTLSLSPSSSYSSTSSFHANDSPTKPKSSGNANTSNVLFARFADTVRDTKSKVEAKKLELNATMQEKLPEWKSKGAIYSSIARETGIEWSRKGKEAVDRWKKEFTDRDLAAPVQAQDIPGVFGMPLEDAINQTSVDKTDRVPAVLRRCIDYLEAHGLSEIGLYRMTGTVSSVNKLKSIFHSGNDVDFEVIRPEPHCVSALLKMYLRELPEPLIPPYIGNQYRKEISTIAQQYDAVPEGQDAIVMETTIASAAAANKTENPIPPMSPATLKAIHTITKSLPPANYTVLRVLFGHLKHVIDHQHENRMSTSNLAVVFIPTLNIGRVLFHCMVEHYDKVFERENSAGPNRVATRPPPVPLKPRNIQLRRQTHTQGSSVDLGKPSDSAVQLQAKTHSDTDLFQINVSASPTRIPPTKPTRQHRSLHHVSQQQSTSSPSLEHHIPQAPKPLTERLGQREKPRSKSVSSPTTQPAIAAVGTPWRRRAGSRVEALGRQFENKLKTQS